MTNPQDITEKDERRLKIAAFATLFGLMGGHALLETARDALFLTNVPAERLPWVYLGIAVAALGVARLQAHSKGRSNYSQQLITLQLFASMITLGFWFLLPSDMAWYYYALYIWSGVIGSVLVVTFWLLLGEIFTITQGKRIYAAIGTGGAAGAIGGFAVASALASMLPAEHLLPASAAVFAASAIGPWTSLRMRARRPENDAMGLLSSAPAPKEPGLVKGLADVARHPYACRVAALVILPATTLTIGDYLFKSVFAASVPPEQLAASLARLYLALNVASMLLLMFGVTRLIRRVSVHRALAILPGFISVAAVGILAGGILVPVMFLKIADGTLRYSLQKTASELLYLPMPGELRARVKGTIDLVGQRGAAAIASLFILFAVSFEGATLLLAGTVLLLSLAWVWLALELRGAYLDVFREALSEGTIETQLEFPELDLGSLETLIRALNHPDDRHVLAALDLLAAKGRVELIPSLILYHPSAPVVTRALDLLATSGRKDFLMLADRLLESEVAEVRAATARAMWAVDPDQAKLERLLESRCIIVRTSAAIGMRIHGWLDAETVREAIEECFRYPEVDARVALANAFKLSDLSEFREFVERLAEDEDERVRKEALQAIRASGDPAYISLLVRLLDRRDIRGEVREALCELGEPALEELARAFARPDIDAALLRHIPRSISRFNSVEAAEILLRELAADPGSEGELRERHSGMVRYKILRGLAPLLTGPLGDQIDKSAIHDAVARTLQRVLQILHWQIWLSEGRNEDEAHQTCGSFLLLQLLEDKERLALQRIFRMLYLIQPEENFRHIWVGLQSGDRRDQSSSLELLENVLGPEQRRLVLALVEPGSAPERLQRSGSPLAGVPLSYAALLAEMGRDQSRALNGLAMYHADEIGLDIGFEQEPVATSPGQKRSGIRERALSLIESMPESRPSRGAVGAT